MKIRKLSESLIAKIAAGEVIERPASVVKELVENAIDAGARNIEIEIGEGGRKRIRVVDDGCGMSREELPLALERHATSKLHEEADLFRISSLGFRGEALPSIAAVSWLEIETACRDESGKGSVGTRMELEGGKTLKVSTGARNRGTTVVVQNLFFNTPARLKFLKSRETEFSHIASLVEAIALSRPEVGFTLTHYVGEIAAGRKEFQSPPRTGHRDRIRDLLGGEIASSLRTVTAGRNGMELVGFVAEHQVNSSSAKSLYFFVNGRSVRDRTLQHAVMAAYENLLMKHRYPWAFLYLTVPPDFVDVNVHPTKQEVRFAQGALVHDLVREGVKKALAGEGRSESPSPVYGRGWIERSESRVRAEDARDTPEIYPTQPPLTKGRSDLKILGQIHQTYLLCETPEKLILIDQHAAHERIGFEKLKKQFESGGVARQALLIPQTFELKPSEAEILGLYLSDLEKFGLEVESFGRASFVLRSVPVLLAGEDCIGLIHDLLEDLQSHGKLGPLQERVHEILETIACHHQVRAGDRLSLPEIEALLQEMAATDFSYSCPHGRPVKLEVGFDEIEKWFRRK